jgi:hypothetical protein
MEPDPEQSFVQEVCLPFLLRTQNANGGWGFHAQSESRVEPTCWALRALHASAVPPPEEGMARGFRFLRASQLADGSWPSTSGERRGCWVTSLCCWLLLAEKDSSSSVAKGLQWLCHDWPRDTAPWRRILSRLSPQRKLHPVNDSYRGWGWTPGTSSWVEPTSFALISLEHAGSRVLPSNARRRRELATAMLYDRMCPGGGWNCGNPRVYGVPGEPLVVPTVWALIALRHDPARQENIESMDWLERNIANIHSGGSLALARICLDTYGRRWPVSAPTLRDLYEQNEFLGNVQVAAWSSLAMSGPSQWLNANAAPAKAT